MVSTRFRCFVTSSSSWRRASKEVKFVLLKGPAILDSGENDGRLTVQSIIRS